MNIDIDVQIGQMLMVGFRGLEVDQASPIVRDIREQHVGGVIVFDYDSATRSSTRNIQSPEQVKHLLMSLREHSPQPLFLAIDQEGGRVCRLKEQRGFPATVSAQYLGRLNQVALTQKYADITAATLADLGLNLNLAPVVDLDINPLSPAIGKVERSFSAIPDIVITHAMEWIRSHHTQHVLCALKHFPGHGSARHDTHHGFVDISDTWSSEELLPYIKILSTGLCDMVMTAHIFHTDLDPDWPATLSHSIITGLLRHELRYDGVIISDDMQMQAITAHYTLEQAVYRAIMAGVDILTFGNNMVYDENISSHVAHIIKKLVPQERIEQSYRRICKLKKRLSSVSFNVH